MSEDNRRRLVAVIGLALGLFLALTLLPFNVTGPIGSVLGPALWSALGAGALGLPLLGLLLGLAGFGRLGVLDGRRVTILVVAGMFLVPYVIGVVARVAQADFLLPHAEWRLAAKATGWFPGFVARTALDSIGLAGGLIAGFVLLTGATLGTLAWHPLRRLEEAGVPGATPEPVPEPPRVRRTTPASIEADEVDEEDEAEPEPAPEER